MEIELEPPLKYLVKTCETICVAECCGIDAYHFSPFHAASYFIRYDNRLDMRQIEDLRRQLADLERLARDLEDSRDSVTIVEMNQVFRSQELKDFALEVSQAVSRAIEMVEDEAVVSRTSQ